MTDMSTAIISTVIALICLYAILSYAKKLKSGCCGGGGEIKIKPADTNTSHYPHKAIIYIDGMTCNHCKMRIENLFNNMENVYAKVNLKKKYAEVWSKEPLDNEHCKRHIENIGYKYIKTDIEN